MLTCKKKGNKLIGNDMFTSTCCLNPILRSTHCETNSLLKDQGTIDQRTLQFRDINIKHCSTI